MNMPSAISSSTSLAQAFFDAHPSVDVVRLITCDYANVTRGCLVTRERLLDIANQQDDGRPSGIDMHSGTLIFCLPDGKILYDVWREGEEDRKPDWSSMRLFSAEKDHAIIFCDLPDGDPSTCEGTVISSNSRDPRVILRRIEKEAKQLGLQMAGGHWMTSAFRDSTYPVLLEMRRNLTNTGVRIWSTEKELGHGQWEISTCPESPTKAADDYVLAHETITTVAWKHGMHATMHSSPFVDASPLGLHFHVSLKGASQAVEDHFLAGIMNHGPGLSAFMLGGYDSYSDRGLIVGGGDITWGKSKMCTIKRAGPGHFEFRLPDAHTNVHLQLAAILGVGIMGVKDNLELSVKESPIAKPGETLSHEQKEELGIKHQVKETLEQRLQCLEDDQEIFAAILGEETINDYLCLRRREIQALSPMDSKVRRRVIIANI